MANRPIEEPTNQILLRAWNEWSEQLNDAQTNRAEPQGEANRYLCECGDPWCTQSITLSRAEYERIRAVPTRFAVALNHENPETDTFITANERFATIEKLFGDGVKNARDTNPRR